MTYNIKQPTQPIIGSEYFGSQVRSPHNSCIQRLGRSCLPTCPTRITFCLHCNRSQTERQRERGKQSVIAWSCHSAALRMLVGSSASLLEWISDIGALYHFIILGGWIERCAGNRTEGASVCTKLGSTLRHLFCFLCDVLSSHPVQTSFINVDELSLTCHQH